MALTGVNSQPKVQADATPVRADARIEKQQDPAVDQAPAKTVAEKAEKAAVELEKALTALTDLITTLGSGKDLGCSGASSRAAEPAVDQGAQALSLDSYENFDFSSLGLNGASTFQAPVAAPVSTGRGNGDFLNTTGAGAGAAKSGGGGKIDPDGYGD